MAVRASAGKVYVGIKVPNTNYKSLETIVENQGGTIAGYINEAIFDWLKAHGAEAEVSIDGRTGKWVRLEDKE